MRKFLARLLLKHFFKAVLPEDILHLKGQDLYFGEVKLGESERSALRSQAETLHESMLYKVLTKSLYYDACKRIYHNDNDTLPGKMQIVTIQTIEEILDECRQL